MFRWIVYGCLLPLALAGCGDESGPRAARPKQGSQLLSSQAAALAKAKEVGKVLATSAAAQRAAAQRQTE